MSDRNEYIELAKEQYHKYSELLIEKFNEHPRKHKMNCGEHFVAAMKSALQSFGAGIVLTVHAIFPMIFETTGSSMIASLNQYYEERRCEHYAESENETTESENEEDDNVDEPENDVEDDNVENVEDVVEVKINE